MFVPYPESQESQEAQKYDFKVCEWYCVEEDELAGALDKSCELNENWCIKLDSCIWDLSIAWRSWWRDKYQHIVAYKMKLRKL